MELAEEAPLRAAICVMSSSVELHEHISIEATPYGQTLLRSAARTTPQKEYRSGSLSP